MASSAPLHIFSPQALRVICPLVRKVQLPARAFQSSARCRYVQKSRFHISQFRRNEQSAVASDAFTNSQTDTRHSPAVDHEDGFPKVRQLEETQEMEEDPLTFHENFRKLMRVVTHPVAIVTSADPKIHSSTISKTWRGATVSSFNSVTIDPEPYISFNIKRRSSTYDAIRNSGLFAVHLMSHTAEAVDIATHFSRGNDNDLFVDKSEDESSSSEPKLHTFASQSTLRPKELSEERYPLLPPLIQWRAPNIVRAVLFQLLCRFEPGKVIRVGDHAIVVGKVLRSYGNVDNATEQQQHHVQVPKRCLTYAKGAYSHPKWNFLLDLKSVRQTVRLRKFVNRDQPLTIRYPAAAFKKIRTIQPRWLRTAHPGEADAKPWKDPSASDPEVQLDHGKDSQARFHDKSQDRSE